MTAAASTCPECGGAVSAREAGCANCGHILDRSPGEVRRGSGGRWFALSCGGCLALVLLATLAIIVLARRELVGVAGTFQRLAIEGDLALLREALERYADEHGQHYPPELGALAFEEDGRGPWIEALPGDPWGRPYRFEPPADGLRSAGRGQLATWGRDGAPGGGGADADLSEENLGLVKR